MYAIVTDCSAYGEIVDEDCLNVSRHRPVITHLSSPNFEMYKKGATEQASVTHRINWDKVTSHQGSDYRAKVAYINACTHTHMVLNNSDIDQFYRDVCNVLTDCANAAIGYKKFKPFLKPYWKHELFKQHSLMRRRRAEWCRDGRPRGREHPSYRDYKDCKRGFRRLLRTAFKTHMNSLNPDIDNSAEINSNDFWKQVTKRRSVYNKNSTGPGIVFNGTVYRDQRAITEQWGEYFQNLYSPATCAHYDDNWYGHATNTVNE